MVPSFGARQLRLHVTPVNREEAPVDRAGRAVNGVEPLAWLTDVLGRMVSGRTKAHELARLPPCHWKAKRLSATVDG
jgi:hypothetical protein